MLDGDGTSFISLGPAGHKFLLLCDGGGRGREHLARCPSAQEAAPRVTWISQFVALENFFAARPAGVWRSARVPLCLRGKAEMGRHGEGVLGALLSSWEFVLLSLSFFFFSLPFWGGYFKPQGCHLCFSTVREGCELMASVLSCQSYQRRQHQRLPLGGFRRRR